MIHDILDGIPILIPKGLPFFKDPLDSFSLIKSKGTRINLLTAYFT